MNRSVHSIVNRSSRRSGRRALRHAALAALASAGFVLGARSARANTENDVSNGQTDLTLSGTYSNGAPGTGNDVTFSAIAYSPASFTLATGINIGTLDVKATNTITISGPGAFTLAGGSNSVSGNTADLLYVASGSTLSTTTAGFVISTALGAGNFDIVGTANLGGVISGTGAFTKIGNGTLLLSGANTYSGNTSLANGTLMLGSSSVGTAGTVGGNGALTSSALGTGYLYIGGGGFIGFDLNGQTFGNRFTIAANNDTVKNTSASAAFVTGALDGSLSSNNVSSFSVGNDNGGDINWSGVISRTNGGGLGLTKTGNDTVTFSGLANTGVGVVAVTAGTLNVGKTGQNGAFADSATVSGGATLRFRPDLGTASGGGVWGGQFNGTLSIASGYIDLYGSSGQNSRVQQVYGSGGTITNSSLAASTLGISARDNKAYSLAAVVQDGTGTVAIDFSNQGFANSGRINEFTAVNTYSGGTSISYGTYELGNALASQNSTITVNAASGLGANGTISYTTTTPLAFANGIGTFTIGGLAGAGNFNLTDIGFTNAFVSATPASVTLQIGSNLTINAAPAAFSGVISNGSVSGGTVVKIGSSTEIFTGANTYTGATSISAGTLQIGNNGTAGALSGSSTVTDNGTFVIYRTNGVSQGTDFGSGAITGTGGLIQKGSGSTTLTALNLYSGGTTVAAGTLVLGSSSAAGVGTYQPSIGNTATTDLNGQTLSNVIVQGGNGAIFTNSSATTANVTSGYNSAGAGSYTISDFTVNGTGDINWSGAIRRTNFTGTVNKSGNNAFILSGVGTSYSGMNYTVTGGTLAFSLTSASTFNSGTIGLTSAGTAAGIEASGSTNTIATAINGAGKFNQTGAGTTILTATNTYTGTTSISAGTLQLGTNGTTGVLSGSSTVTDNGTFVINRSNNVAQGTDFGAAAITGTGGLVQSGNGATTLSAANTYSGGTTISGGTLVLGSSSVYTGTVTSSGALGTGFVANNQRTLDLNGQTLSNQIIQNTNGGSTNGTFTNSSATTAFVTTGFNVGGVISDFTVNGTGDINWSGAINRGLFAPGTVTKNSSNTLILSGAGTGYVGMNYTVTGGTLAFSLTSGSTFNSGTVGLTSGGAATGIEGSGSINTIATAINGAGTFSQTGAGTTLLTAANTYTGATNIAAGTLATDTSGGTIGNSIAIGVSATGALTLGNAASINDAATLQFSDTSAINLNAASGSESISALVDLTGTALTLTAPGTYTAAQLDTYFSDSVFSSLSGETITIVPEPTSIGLIGMASVGLLSRRRRRRAM